MFRENSNMCQSDTEVLGLSLSSADYHSVQMKGDIIDRIHYADGRVEERVGHNIVVNSFLNLVMCLLKQQSGYTGIQYWAVGSGADSWDNATPDPNITDTRLVSEIGRVEIPTSEISFLDAELNPTSTPTNIIQITHTFGPNDCNGKWREFGIFGGNASASANSGIMINHRHHPILTKTNEMTVERVMRFTLTLV